MCDIEGRRFIVLFRCKRSRFALRKCYVVIVKANVTFLVKLSQDEITLTMLGLQNPEYESAQSEHLFTLREKSHRATL